ncbi:PREDICTED: translation initiation factor IF-2-like [Nicrophorus vespilloides]|uniref:Translation initiation factor IF-2-like n=1 Tax=Nicrophorus vespilloides TaxID=110193 RepID=A0ABM1NHC5_NICVS|nr:PREDICTED: translation initiation factor IF-2-like [Nicrophorus vespilloides]
MRSAVTVLAAVAVFVAVAEEQKAGVVYLIDTIGRKNPESIGGSDNKDLSDTPFFKPLPADKPLPDGIYFRPEDGKPLENPDILQDLRVKGEKEVREKRSAYPGKGGGGGACCGGGGGGGRPGGGGGGRGGGGGGGGGGSWSKSGSSSGSWGGGGGKGYGR